MIPKPKIILGSDLGIRLDTLDRAKRTQLEWLLTANPKAWKEDPDNPPATVEGFHEHDGYLWVPRQFGLQMGYVPERDDRSPGSPYEFAFKARLDPNRGQTEAVPAMAAYIRKHGSGLLVAPTGCGKTLLSYAVGSRFNTCIGVFIYAGHMLDNWIQQAELAFGLKPEDIGIVQQDRCDLGKPITIMSIQSLLARRYPDELYNQIGFLVCDEVNRFGAAEWNKCIRQFPGMYRLGVSADPSRKDGLERVISWNLGSIGYTIKKITVQMTVIGMHIETDYPPNSYKDWKKSEEKDEFVGDPMRYDKKLANDMGRNRVIVELLIDARRKNRRIIVFSRLRDHLTTLKTMLDVELEKLKETDYPATQTAFLVGGMKKQAREDALKADIKFSTYSFARDALNDTSLDTEIFATPPGDPLQPAGRLRDKGAKDRNPLMLVDLFESNDYSKNRWERRRGFYEKCAFTVKLHKKKP